LVPDFMAQRVYSIELVRSGRFAVYFFDSAALMFGTSWLAQYYWALWTLPFDSQRLFSPELLSGPLLFRSAG